MHPNVNIAHIARGLTVLGRVGHRTGARFSHCPSSSPLAVVVVVVLLLVVLSVLHTKVVAIMVVLGFASLVLMGISPFPLPLRGVEEFDVIRPLL